MRLKGLTSLVIFIALFLCFFLPPQSISALEDEGCVYFFYSPTCRHCRSLIDRFLPPLLQKYPSAKIKYFNIDKIENYELMLKMERNYGVQGKELPELFVGNSFLYGKKEIKRKLEAVIQSEIKALKKIEVAPPKGIQETITRFKGFGALTVAGGGLLDGINPCAFATIVYFISFLAFMERGRREILIVGLTFIATVFATYLAIGLGLFKGFQSLPSFSLLAEVFRYAIALFALALGGLNLYDYYKYRKRGAPGETILKLPKLIQQLIHRVIRNLSTLGRQIITIVLITALTAFVISLLETVCTGQIYLPTIMFVSRMPDLRINALSYLVLYNLFFILPLALVFVLAFLGVGSDKLSHLTQKYFGSVKILTAAFFLFLGAAIWLT